MHDKADESPLETYFRHCREGRLAYQVDPETGKALFFPRLLAPVTGSADLIWKVSAGLGTVYATTTCHRKNEAPYNVALIDMDEGFRLMSRVEGIAVDSIAINMRVEVVMQPGSEKTDPYPLFVPVNGDRA